MGALIAVLGSVTVGGESLISHAASFLDPLGALMGMDGEILLAFILGWPANEIVIPILIMLYTAEGSFGTELGISAMSELFMANGWDGCRAVCVAIFALFHWPCSTSVITVYKETGSIKHTVMAAILPTLLGFLICATLNILI